MPEHVRLRRVGTPRSYIVRGLMEPGGDDNKAGFHGLSGSVSKEAEISFFSTQNAFPFCGLRMAQNMRIYVNNREWEISKTADT